MISDRKESGHAHLALCRIEVADVILGQCRRSKEETLTRCAWRPAPRKHQLRLSEPARKNKQTNKFVVQKLWAFRNSDTYWDICKSCLPRTIWTMVWRYNTRVIRTRCIFLGFDEVAWGRSSWLWGHMVEEDAHSRMKVFITPSRSPQTFPFVKVW